MSALKPVCAECKQPIFLVEPTVTTQHQCTQIFHETCWKPQESTSPRTASEERNFWIGQIQNYEAEEYGWDGITPASELERIYGLE